MTTDLSIIEQVKAVEAEVAAEIAAAETGKTAALAEAGRRAAVEVTEVRERLRRQHEAAMEKARAEAARLLEEAAHAASRDVGSAEAVSGELHERAVRLVLDALKSRWQ